MAEHTYSYQAFNNDGKKEGGTIQASSQDQALETLARRGLTVDTIKQVSPAGAAAASGSLGNAGVSSDELSAFAYELATLLQAGMSLAPALELLVNDDGKGKMSQVTLAVLKDVRAGMSFSSALERYPGTFPPMMSSLVKAGEGLGGLDKAMAQIADFLENADKVRNRIVSALAYPLTVSGMAFAIITALFLFMVPRLKDIYSQIGVPIPPMTSMLLDLGQAADTGAMVVLAVAFLGAPAMRAYLRSPRGRLAADRMRLKLPLLGPIFSELALASFHKTLAVLHRSGVVLHRAVELAAGASGNGEVQARLLKAVPLLQQGRTLGQAMATLGLYQPKLLGMLEAGEKGGNLADMLAKMADFTENRCQHKVDRLMALVEPLTIGFLGGMVGAAVLVLGAPLMSLSTQIH